MSQTLVKPVRFPPREPDYVCQNCGWRCWISEEGYAFGYDDEPINCKNCGQYVADHGTYRHVRTSWKPPE